MFPGKNENVEAGDGFPKCFLDIASEAEPGCRIVVELFADKLPKTCANFVKLVKGGHTDAMGKNFLVSTASHMYHQQWTLFYV